MAKKNNNVSKSTPNLVSKQKKIGVLATVGVGIFIFLILMFTYFSDVKIGTGQATYSKSGGVDSTVQYIGSDLAVGQSKKIFFPDSYDAAPGDTVSVAVSFTSDSVISASDFELIYPKDKMILLPDNDCATGKTCSVVASYGGLLWPSAANPHWGTMKTSDYLSGNHKLLTFNFKVLDTTPIGDLLTLELKEATLAYEKIVYGSYSVKTVVTVVPKCQDDDVDQYGKPNTDQRACGNRHADSVVAKSGVGSFSDCNDNSKPINPAADEKCDGIDNNCNDDNEGAWDNDPNTGLDKKLTAGVNSNLQGVCYGKQVCATLTGTTKFYDSYLVTGAVLIEGKKQSDLYTPGKDACDFYDNDCDGLVNEDDPACKIGGGVASVGLLPTGNTFLTYDAANKLATQATGGVDVSLLYVLNDARSDTNVGGNTQLPYKSKVKGNLAWVCDSGLYYVELAPILPALAPSYEKHFYDADKVVLQGVTKNNAGNLVVNAVEIKC